MNKSKQLDSYSILIICKYFKTPEDFINIICVCKKFNETLKKLRFNPISIITKKLFPLIQTQYLYFPTDERIPTIEFYCYDCKITFSRFFFTSNKQKTKFKCVEYTLNDRMKFGNKIPKLIKSLGKGLFADSNFEKIIPSSPPHCSVCNKLHNIVPNSGINENPQLNHSRSKNILLNLQLDFLEDNINELTDQQKEENKKFLQIPNYIQSIGSECFLNCSSLTFIKLSNTITELGNGAFKNCAKVSHLILSTNITSLPPTLCYGCHSLSQISFPPYLVSIGDNAFAQCTNLVSLQLPQTITSIGSFAFCGCSSLRSVNIPSINKINPYTFSECFSLYQISIPSTVTAIDTCAFKKCTSLTQIGLCSSLVKFGDSCFYQCHYRLFKDYILPERCFINYN
ncbi:hypothetical protein ENUP19_0038G0064 [Entamoeba nuttalli]|uniref:Leucine rich repeat protein, BspA family protein n=2 Tax=Entamoeba nuttalli TaxID=412467 RepID=K2GW95_ENTNP|nr:leucine rich repeat protein, BspA family protein [Entamoeba nuttalli P19]EKE39483.1 leucine rich repeat protein, BspA family protein [Entamoeba nuttalli P19]|eukprot:XP_008858188.1 leucine rich repeat protein, BspA family protein [Entamoeba nuttalli P19]